MEFSVMMIKDISTSVTFESGIIVGAMAVEGNAYDGHTLESQLKQVKELTV